MDGLVKVYLIDPCQLYFSDIIMYFSGFVLCISYLGKSYEIKKPADVVEF